MHQDGRGRLWKLKIELTALEDALRGSEEKPLVLEDWPADGAAEQDEELDSLRGNPEFAALIKKYAAKNP